MTQGHRVDTGRTKVSDRWWRAKQDEKHGDVWQTVERIRSLWDKRTKFDRHHMELYSNQNVAGLGSGDGVKRSRVRFNLVAQAINTAASQIATQRPKPMYLTSEGDFGLQRQARLRTRVLEGQLHDLKAYEIMPRVFIDAAVCGTGFVYGYLDPDSNEPCIERCLPGTVWVDPRDGLRGDPMCIYYRVPVARDVISEMYPDVDETDLENAAGPNPNDKTDLWLTQDSTCDDVMVVFAFRRRTTKKSKDGRLVISLSSCTLLDTKWEHDLPFVRVAWQERQLGYYASGIAEAGRDPQARILKSISRHDEAQDRGSTTWCLTPRQAKVRTEKLSNSPMTLVHYDGPNAPQIQAFDGAPPGLDEAVDRIREQFFAELGISTMVAQAEKPAGLDSAPSLREYQDQTSQRQQIPARQYETGFMDLVRLLEMLNERAQAKNDGYQIMARTQRGRTTLVKQVKWSSVYLDENKYRLTCWPTSMLPATPAGRMAMVSDWIASGFISRPNAQQLLLDIPDTDQAARIELADMDCVMADIERILDGYSAYPEPYQDLALAGDIARRSYLGAKSQGADEDTLQALRDYVNDCLELQGLPAMDAPKQLAQPQVAPVVDPMQPAPTDALAMVPPTQGQGSPMLM